jgi:xanthine dehydrogenase molybdenum-binding subunit
MNKEMSSVEKTTQIVAKEEDTVLKYVGKDIVRIDIERKIDGRFHYLADLPPNGSLHACLLLSTVAHGRVLSIDDSEAMKVPGVKRVFTFRDDPGVRFNSQVSLPDQEDFRDERIFTDLPLFVGDRIGAVLAENAQAARTAASLVKITYETFEPILDPEQALVRPSVTGRATPGSRGDACVMGMRSLTNTGLSLPTPSSELRKSTTPLWKITSAWPMWITTAP